MNLPNKLTTARLVLTAAFVAALSVPAFPNRFALATALFLVASLTDFLDGYIARKHNLVTDFGKLMDPLVDKILTGSVFIMLSAFGAVPAWATIVIIAREFLVTGLRLLASAAGAVLAADRLGKWKTISQIAAATYFLLQLGADEAALGGVAWATGMGAPELVGNSLLAVCVTLTLVSGWSYIWKNRELIRDC